MAPSDAKSSKRCGWAWAWSWWYAHARTNSSHASTFIHGTIPHRSLFQMTFFFFTECATAWHAPTDPTTNKERGGNSRNDENFNAKSGWRPRGYGGNATHDEPSWRFGGLGRIGWWHAKYE